MSISPLGWFGPAPIVGGGYAAQQYGGGGGGLGNIIILAVGAAIVYGLVTSFLDNRSDSGGGAAEDTVSGACPFSAWCVFHAVPLLAADAMCRQLHRLFYTIWAEHLEVSDPSLDCCRCLL